ncbi:Coiled-coil domain-containing protein 90B, mitochondrial [Merluccius polli]|uniref:Coiled-coil domain-containing protein 90B, mitochondrial n=1 Tax=Merluccius polli TaxID=89951 RepID=A0AA47NZ16_MERPO|nr:Coiled-coil domain-containing protein 90B, mitochondrial [Merluccius polli]
MNTKSAKMTDSLWKRTTFQQGDSDGQSRKPTAALHGRRHASCVTVTPRPGVPVLKGDAAAAAHSPAVLAGTVRTGTTMNPAALRSLVRRRLAGTMATVARNVHVGCPTATHTVRKVELTPLEQRKLTFDSHAVVTDLEKNGFEKKQAEIIVSALVTLTTANMDIVYKDMVTSSHQEVALQQILAHLDSLRKDMVILEKSEFANLRSENEKMKRELDQLKARLTEESQRVRGEARLDINLERSRISDMFTEQEKKLLEATTEFHRKNANLDHDTMETNKKIDLDVASLKTLLESLKLETVRYLAASVFACLAIALGFYRLWKGVPWGHIPLPSHLSHHVGGGSDALELLLLGSLLGLLDHLLIHLLKEQALGSLLEISNLLKLDPVLRTRGGGSPGATGGTEEDSGNGQNAISNTDQKKAVLVEALTISSCFVSFRLDRGGAGDDARGDEFRQEVVDVHLAKVALWGAKLSTCRKTSHSTQ